MKKGQAALEFLSTYGWAFLVILVMIGALAYFGVLDPKRFVSERCFLGSEYLCDKDTVATNYTGETVVIQVVNKANKVVTATGGTLTADDVTCDPGSFTPTSFAKNAKGNLTFDNCNGTGWVQGDKLTADFTFEYTVDGFQKAAPGNLVVTII